MRRFIRAIGILACVPALAQAQTEEIVLPSNSLLPNYERVPLGQREAIEAGAYLVRTDDALSSWYNPAGLVSSQRTQVSASSNSYEAVTLEMAGQRERTRSLRFAPLGSFFGVVIAEPINRSGRYRLGFSIANPVAWAPGNIDFDAQLGPGARVGFVNSMRLSRTEYALSLGYRAGARLRLGASAGVSTTSLTQNQDLLLTGSDPNPALTRRRTLSSDGSVWHAIGQLGAQVDVTEALGFGVLLRSSGLRIGGSTTLFTTSGAYAGDGIEDVSFIDGAADFDYRLPFSLAAGAALRFGRGAIEVDVRYYGDSGTHALFESEVTGIYNVANTGGTTSTEVGLAPKLNAWRDVVNVAVGGNYQLTDELRIHAGFNTDRSPVADPQTSMFRRVDLLGFSTGVSFTVWQFVGSLGLGYSAGESDPMVVAEDANGAPVTATLSVNSFRVSYAVTFLFGDEDG
jgi:long-subunit fatty acid transport protein